MDLLSGDGSNFIRSYDNQTVPISRDATFREKVVIISTLYGDFMIYVFLLKISKARRKQQTKKKKKTIICTYSCLIDYLCLKQKISSCSFLSLPVTFLNTHIWTRQPLITERNASMNL